MPEDHQKYLDWNGDRFRRWAEKIGTNTHEVVNGILASGRVEQQSYRGCMGLLRLVEKYSAALLEDACKRALAFSHSPSYKSIKNLLVTLKDKPVDETQEPWKVNQYGITRGAGYYGGNRDD